MNLQLNTNCFQLSIDAPAACTSDSSNSPVDPVEPDGKYEPSNSANPYDEAGRVHNEIIRKLRRMRAEKPLDNKQIMQEATKMVKSYKYKTKALQSLELGDIDAVHKAFTKYGVIDGCIPFPWPWLPGGDTFGFPFPGSGNHLRTIDPIEIIFILIDALRGGRIPIFAKNDLVEWENSVMESSMEKSKMAACLMTASIARYSIGLAVEDNAGEDIAAKKVSPWWSFVADGVGGLIGSLGGGLGTIVGAAAASGVADAAIDNANEG